MNPTSSSTTNISTTNASPANASPAIIEVNNVIKRFKVGDGEVTILKGISFEIGRGEFVFIVGPSGNGKSTLLNYGNGYWSTE